MVHSRPGARKAAALALAIAVGTSRVVLRGGAPSSRRSRKNLAITSSPRAVMLAHLSADMGAALAAGDVEAARIAHDAIGKLLGMPGLSAAVVDLAAERERRAE